MPLLLLHTVQYRQTPCLSFVAGGSRFEPVGRGPISSKKKKKKSDLYSLLCTYIDRVHKVHRQKKEEEEKKEEEKKEEEKKEEEKKKEEEEKGPWRERGGILLKID